MAISPLGSLPSLAGIPVAAPVNPLQALIQSFQQGVGLAQLPQKLEQDALNQQLQTAINQAKLAELQGGKVFEVGGSLVRQNPTSGQFETVFSTATPNKPIEIGGSLAQFNPATNKYETVYTAPGTGAQKSLHFADVGDAIIGQDPLTGKEISRTPKTPGALYRSTPNGLFFAPDPSKPSEGSIIKGTEPVAGSGLKPNEVISAKKDIQSTYQDSPSTIDYFGKGQVPGSQTLKARLDAVLDPVNGDFEKLNPQASQTFIFAMNKLRDPTSATLLTEARQIADKAGIGERFNAYIRGLKEGDPLPPQVARDIYQVISQVNAVHKQNLISDLIQRKQELDTIGRPLTSIGVPKALADEVEGLLSAPIQSQQPSFQGAQPFPSEEAARQAGKKAGDIIILDGRPARLK